MPKHVLIILANGHEEVEAITQVDLLRRAGIKVTMVGLTERVIRGAHGITITTDICLEDFNETIDAVVLPGGMPGTNYLCESQRVIETVRNANEKGAICAAICAAPMVLDRAGLLSGKNYTCYPSITEKIKNGSYLDQAVVIDRNIITSKGVGTAIAFALQLISTLISKDQAKAIGSQVLYSGDI